LDKIVAGVPLLIRWSHRLIAQLLPGSKHGSQLPEQTEKLLGNNPLSFIITHNLLLHTIWSSLTTLAPLTSIAKSNIFLFKVKRQKVMFKVKFPLQNFLTIRESVCEFKNGMKIIQKKMNCLSPGARVRGI
jgi:hypothetical protein